MKEITLHVEENQWLTFLHFLKTLNYVEVVTPKTQDAAKKNGKFEKYPTTDLPTVREQAVGQEINGIPLKYFDDSRPTFDLVAWKKEHNYKPIDWQDFDKHVENMDIQEPIEELLNQLTK
jgi:hypothetical protein